MKKFIKLLLNSFKKVGKYALAILGMVVLGIAVVALLYLKSKIRTDKIIAKNKEDIKAIKAAEKEEKKIQEKYNEKISDLSDTYNKLVNFKL